MTTNRKMWRKLRATEKRECIRGVEDKRADSLNDKGEERDLRHKMGGKEYDVHQHINREKHRKNRE